MGVVSRLYGWESSTNVRGFGITINGPTSPGRKSVIVTDTKVSVVDGPDEVLLSFNSFEGLGPSEESTYFYVFLKAFIIHCTNFTI